MHPDRGNGSNVMTVMGLPGGDARTSRREDRHPLFATVIRHRPGPGSDARGGRHPAGRAPAGSAGECGAVGDERVLQDRVNWTFEGSAPEGVVTHVVSLARELSSSGRPPAVFLRAQRGVGGTRPYRIVPGEPLRTSFAEDLWEKEFGYPLGGEASGGGTGGGE